ncbi:ATP-binding cassette sub- G member 4 [Gurleya vavrai]
MNLSFKNIVIDALNKNKGYGSKYIKLVDNACGEVNEGELLAIMGPSGCGKTTLLSALAGRIQKGAITYGEVKFNGKERDTRKWLSEIGFVDQDDQIFEKLTVFEMLFYAATFRLKNIHGKEIRLLIEDLINSFGLKNVAFNQMYKLSGGERKRTMIAIELITDPTVIFLDEPTSGLDTKTALKIMKILNELTKKGKIIVITIHQPSVEIYNMFDKILLMSHGKTIYNGNANSFEELLKSKGIFKREGISFPDFIAEMAVKEDDYREENVNLKKIFNMIDEFDNQNKINENMKPEKKNEKYKNFRLDLKHIFYIAKRKARIDFARKYQFYKGLIIQIFIIVLFYFFFNFYVNMFQINLKDALSEINYFKVNKMNLIILIGNKVSNIVIHTFSISLFFVLASMLGATAFFAEQNIIKREIASGTYTTISYYTATLIYCLLNRYLCILLSMIPVVFISRYLFTPIFILILVLSPLFGIIFTMAFGSFFSSKKITVFVTSFLNVLFIPAAYTLHFWDIALTHILPSGISFLRYLQHIFILYPNFHFSSIIIQITIKSLEDFMKKEKLLKLVHVSFIRFLYSSSQNYILDFTSDIYYSASFIFFIMIMAFTFGVYRQNSILMPQIRMKLQNK